MILWGVNPRFHGLSPCIRQVAYALRTRPPVAPDCSGMPLDLHVLSLPLAFILSQDQTLHCKYNSYRLFLGPREIYVAVHISCLASIFFNHLKELIKKQHPNLNAEIHEPAPLFTISTPAGFIF